MSRSGKQNRRLAKRNEFANAFFFSLLALGAVIVVAVSISRLLVTNAETKFFEGEFIRFEKSKSAFSPRYSKEKTTVVGLFFRPANGQDEQRLTTLFRGEYAALKPGDRISARVAGDEIVEMNINGEQTHSANDYRFYSWIALAAGIALGLFGAAEARWAYLRGSAIQGKLR